jgi:hypothetical protein
MGARLSSARSLALFTLFALSLAAVPSCATLSSGPVVALPNGYYLRPDAHRRTELVKRNGRRIVPAPIAAYAVSRHVVTGAFGEVSAEGHAYVNDLPFEGGPDTRYFVLDTATGRLDDNLDAAAWRHRLDELGAPASLKIYPPLPWS